MKRDIRNDPWHRKLRRNLSRPLPDLYAFACAKLLSRLWASTLGNVGTQFHVSRGTRIAGGKAVHIGDRFYMGPSLWIEAVREFEGTDYEPSIRIGHRVTGSDFIHIAAIDQVTIGDDVLLGSRVHITDHSHGRYVGPDQSGPDIRPLDRPLFSGGHVAIGNRVWLGDGVVVLAGVSIGDGSIVGANSVVTRSLPAGIMAVGSPARVVKSFDAANGQWVRSQVDR